MARPRVSMPSCVSGRSPTRVVPGTARAALRRRSGDDLRARPWTSSAQLLERNLAERSYAGLLETAADGLADVGLSGGPAHARRGAIRPAGTSGRAPRATAARRAGGAPAPPGLRARRGRRCADAPCAGSWRAPARWPSTSRPIAARSAPRPTGRPPTAPCAFCRSRRASATRSSAESSTATAVAPRPLLRLLADGREIIAHNARYEQAWLTFHYGLPAWRSVFDTSCAFRVFERHWSIQDPDYDAPRRDARDRHAAPARRAQGRLRLRLVGRRAAAGRATRLRRLRRGRAAPSARPRARAGGSVRLHARRCWRPRARPASRRSGACPSRIPMRGTRPAG